ncbi:GGDEF domain-containing protein [Cohnella lubricantis]|uniref:GGDEF domain-containing protein n=1 Tax=Cohnella lubricantis TaxID=2163172 RepID=A0A841TFW2_9BACL|nr:GGDEF domain-containing protein [Cohnella lubricantis]MBB6678120.1 GGDEF domain-containing protein [Cohnella lubricantis]MBP2116707.1 diguanylate cyclase (GGDEF)-like protein [Cohnella lubricantis]
MENFRPFEYNQLKWNRRLLHLFWFMVLLSLIVECTYLGDAPSVGEFVWMYIVRPTVLLVAVILMAEAGIRYLPKQHDYILISSSALIAIIITIINLEQTFVLFSLFVPVLVSFFYYQLQKLLFAVATMFLSFGVICCFDHNLYSTVNVGKISGILSIMVLMCLLMVGMMMRGTEVSEYIRSAYEARQALLDRPDGSEKLIFKDPLTNVYNHTSFHEHLDLLIKQCEAGSTELHVALVDLDRFREWNASYGYRAGDEVLRSVASIVQAKIGYRHLLARYGGEEFAILFVGTSLQAASDKLEEIREAISAVPHSSFNHGHVTVSAGLSSYSAELGKEAFLERVRTALGEAKRLGPNRTEVA